MDVLAGKFLNQYTGAVEDTASAGSTAVTKDSIKFTYFIHHQRFYWPSDRPNRKPIFTFQKNRNCSKSSVNFFNVACPSQLFDWKRSYQELGKCCNLSSRADCDQARYSFWCKHGHPWSYRWCRHGCWIISYLVTQCCHDTRWLSNGVQVSLTFYDLTWPLSWSILESTRSFKTSTWYGHFVFHIILWPI